MILPIPALQPNYLISLVASVESNQAPRGHEKGDEIFSLQNKYLQGKCGRDETAPATSPPPPLQPPMP